MIFVADYYNHRIQLLTPELQLVRHLITDVKYPRQVCLNSTGELLIVGFEDGSISSYRVREARE
jgi:6-phosphogluconolactonase (cycloisomerase 2 family)